jgi:hypothetical protein
MAGEAEAGKENLVESQVVAPENLTSPEDEDSLGAIVAKVQHPVFSGHPAMGEGEGGEAGLEEKPEETLSEVKEPQAPPEKKYKTWEDAEAGAREHQSAFTKKAEEAKREKEAREVAEQEREELRQKLAEKEAAAPPEKPAEPAKTPEEQEAAQEAKIEQALDEIGQLDEFDPDYKKKVAKSWRKAGIGGTGQPTIPTDKALDEIIDKRVDARIQAKEAVKASEAKKTEEVNVRTRASEMAGKAGLSMEEGTADNILFWATVSKMPKEFDDKPFDEQVQWTVNEVRRLKGEVVQSKEEMAARARKTQTDNAVLERGAERPQKPAAPDPYTLGSIMNKHQASRRI